jgi:hypothetical protein
MDLNTFTYHNRFLLKGTIGSKESACASGAL